MEPRCLCILGMCSASELHSQAQPRRLSRVVVCMLDC